jgi:hypothetical protein
MLKDFGADTSNNAGMSAQMAGSRVQSSEMALS